MPITPKENMRLVYQHKEPEYLPLNADIQMLRTVEPGFGSVIYEGRPATCINETDWFGQGWVYEPTIGAYNPDANNYIVKDVTRWREYTAFPDLDAIDWKAKFAADGFEQDDNKLLLLNDGYGPWERAFLMIPMSDLLCALIEEPEACGEFFSEVADFKIMLHNHYLDYYKPEVVRLHEDYGSGGGLFMSPGTWRELIKPHLQRIIDNITSKGIIYEHHCCGYMVPLAEEIADMGASSWNNVHISNDPYACKQKFGDRLAFIGGICNGQYLDSDSVSDAQVREHIRETAEKMLPGPGVVIEAMFRNHPEREAIFMEELLKCGERQYGRSRPE